MPLLSSACICQSIIFFIISQDYWCALIYLEDIAAVWGLVENLLQGTTPHF